MQSKASKAALKEIGILLKTIKMAKGYMADWSDYHKASNKILECHNQIEKIVTEYGLGDEVLKKATEEAYNKLMEEECYTEAASFAKKYGL
ncbi:MAG: hypothetical protein AB1610_07470 [Nitrospirota bacterium]